MNNTQMYKASRCHALGTLQHKSNSKAWAPEKWLEIVMQVIAGKSIKSIAVENGIQNGMLY